MYVCEDNWIRFKNSVNDNNILILSYLETGYLKAVREPANKRYLKILLIKSVDVEPKLIYLVQYLRKLREEIFNILYEDCSD